MQKTFGSTFVVALMMFFTVGLSSSGAFAENDKLFRKIDFHNALKNDFKIGSLHTKTFKIETRSDRRELKDAIDKLVAQKQKRMPDEAQLSLREASRLLDIDQPTHGDLLRLQETVEAYNSNFLSPVPSAIWIGAAPYEALKMIRHSIMNKQASEVGDPVQSAFWNIEKRPHELYFGFNRTSFPVVKSDCTYLEPKKSYGVHGGFKMDCGASGKLKAKFGNESKSEPFSTRVVWALGYNATPIDYMPEGTKLVYDRRAITEYNSRKALEMDFKSVLGFSYFKKNIQVPLNPFEDAFTGAILQDGSFVKSSDLRRLLVKSIPQKKHKDDWSKLSKVVFNEKFEKTVKYLVLHEGSIESSKAKELEEMGSWSWKSVDHPDRRELRAFGMFTAWVNSFDIRQNNNKTFLKTNADGSTQLVQSVSDLGSGFGTAYDILHYYNSEFDELPWDLVRLRAGAADVDNDSNEDGDTSEPWTSPYKFLHYSVIERNPAFSNAQLEDARWIVRKLASFSEAQIQDCLIASGFTAAETKLVLEKLLDRRKQMVNVFGLAGEFPDVVSRKIDRSLAYSAQREGAPKTTSGIAARVTNQKVVNGHLIEN